MEAARDREVCERTIAGLRDALDGARSALASAAPPEELALARERATRAEQSCAVIKMQVCVCVCHTESGLRNTLELEDLDNP